MTEDTHEAIEAARLRNSLSRNGFDPPSRPIAFDRAVTLICDFAREMDSTMTLGELLDELESSTPEFSAGIPA